MASRKRPRQDDANANGHHDQNNNNDSRGSSNKKSKKNQKSPQSHSRLVQHAVLVQYYSQIHTLRDWVLSKLPKTSKIRRRKLASLGLDASSAGKSAWSEDEIAVGALLDTTLVAVRHVKSEEGQGESEDEPDHRWQKWIAFSQGCGGDESYVTLSGGDEREAAKLQSEMVDYVIWLLFSREIKPGTWPKHMLCDGFRKSPTSRPQQQPQHQGSGLVSVPGSEKSMAAANSQPNIPGVFQLHHNHCVTTLKESPWPQLLTLLGQSGQRIMLDLLLDCSIFVAVKAGRGNYHQLTGMQLSEMDTLTAVCTAPKGSPSKNSARKNTPALTLRQLSEITFVRSRMMYARAALNARGNVHFGLRHIHVLNRFPRMAKAQEDSKNEQGTDGIGLDTSVVHIMMYMFPRQFGLHNVFTSIVDRQKTAQKLQDYTLREEEIAKKYPKTADGQSVKHVPKRLRGKLPQLIKKLQVLHERCSYSKMLHYYCPAGQSQDSQNNEPTTTQKASTCEEAEEDHGAHGDGIQPTQNRSLLLASRPQTKPTKKRRQSRQATGPAPVTLHYDALVDLATPVSSISAFCQAVLSKTIPNEFWGQGSVQEHNKSLFLKRVHEFICLRRFESMCLHRLMQGMKIADIEWLTPPKLGVGKISQSDFQKRTEIFSEFLYYLFDSLLIPLVRSNFYVTESNTHRYKLFFFRHDIWRQIAEPAMATLKAGMFEEVRLSDAMRILGSRKLGYSQVRLLPKRDTMRPIMNLRRRTVLQGNKKLLGPSINTVLGPVSEVLKLEKSLHPDRLGAAMFSVGDIYHRIKAFKTRLIGGDHNGKLLKLYFAKVDVQAAFDTIPQEAMVRLLSKILQQSRYRISKHAEVQPLESNSSAQNGKSSLATKTFKRWHSTPKLTSDTRPFCESIEASTVKKNKKDTIFVGSALERHLQTRDVLSLAGSHIKENLVKVGKKYYRQKRGIPQGSVLSSLLCSYFYADLERGELGFLEEPDGEEERKGTLLMRLIDDFLLVTTDRGKAEKFVKVMYEGFEDYGVKVRLEKSLVNFGMRIGGIEVPRVQPQRTEDGKGKGRLLFPYCRVLIDCDSLDVGKQRDEGMLGGRDPVIFNSLTVEYSRCPGQNFKRKVLNAFKIQSHLMFFDTSHNSPQAVLRNAYTAFLETATKMWAYARCLPRENKPSPAVVRDTLTSLVDVAYLLLTSRSRKQRYPGYVCSLGKGQVAWLVYTAVGEVLGRKQAGYGVVLEWVRGEIGRLELEAAAMDGRTNGLSVLKRAVTEGGRGKYRGGL